MLLKSSCAVLLHYLRSKIAMMFYCALHVQFLCNLNVLERMTASYVFLLFVQPELTDMHLHQLLTVVAYQALSGTSLIHGRRNLSSGAPTTENIVKVYCCPQISFCNNTTHQPIQEEQINTVDHSNALFAMLHLVPCSVVN